MTLKKTIIHTCESKNIRRFNDKIYIGSPGSKVDKIHFSKESLLSKYTSFEIEY